MKKILTLLFISITVQTKAYIPKADWTSHFICQKDTKFNQAYCLDLVELPSSRNKKEENIVLLVPGLFHNVHYYDLAPESGISFARYIRDQFNVKVYMLNLRTVGKSDYISKTNIDDLAIDDIPAAVNFLFKRYKKKIILLGHSQGAITSNASLSGLTRCEKKNCFDKSIAVKRQSKIKSLILLAGNNKLDIKNPNNPLHKLIKYRKKIEFLISPFDKIDVDLLTFLFQGTGHLPIWSFLVNEDNVSGKTRRKLVKRSIEATSKGILLQFAKGVTDKNLQSFGGESYSENSKNLKVPVYQQVYGRDPLSEAEPTRDDCFYYIGSKQKRFEVIKDFGHEDIFLNKNLHRFSKKFMNFALNPR